MKDIKNLESIKVFEFFEQISKIPRESHKEEKISNFLVDFAKERNLEVYQDEMFNVIIKKSATKGYENAPTVAIQSHIDMVCEKNKGTEHDFDKDPIKLIYENGFIKADGTTLGADNGIGVSMALATLDSKDLAHPPIEAIFTTCEEVGMDGATALDEKQINAKILLNIDSEKEGVFTAGCAGGMKVICHIPVEYENTKESLVSYSIFVNGLKGGHSGIDVLKERANSNIILARTLNTLLKEFDIKLNKISGGAKDNAIPREAEAVISISKDSVEQIKAKIKYLLSIYKNEFKASDENINITFEEVKKSDKNIKDSFVKKVISSILLVPNGVEHMNIELVNMPESSNNIGVIECDEKEVRFICAVRSAGESRKHLIYDKLQSVSELAGGHTTLKSEYPGWEYDANSFIRNKCCEIYQNMFGEEVKVSVVHAGLECGIFVQKLKDLDAISFGPNLSKIHTPMESADIFSINKIWKFLLEVLKEIK